MCASSARLRQPPRRESLAQGRAPGQVAFERAQFHLHWTGAKLGANFAQRALEGNAGAQHSGQLLVQEREFVEFH